MPRQKDAMSAANLRQRKQLRAMNAGRSLPITLHYCQYLAALYDCVAKIIAGTPRANIGDRK